MSLLNLISLVTQLLPEAFKIVRDVNQNHSNKENEIKKLLATGLLTTIYETFDNKYDFDTDKDILVKEKLIPLLIETGIILEKLLR